jgi:hypothetical protein
MKRSFPISKQWPLTCSSASASNIRLAFLWLLSLPLDVDSLCVAVGVEVCVGTWLAACHNWNKHQICQLKMIKRWKSDWSQTPRWCNSVAIQWSQDCSAFDRRVPRCCLMALQSLIIRTKLTKLDWKESGCYDRVSNLVQALGQTECKSALICNSMNTQKQRQTYIMSCIVCRLGHQDDLAIFFEWFLVHISRIRMMRHLW